ncbi:hypothetical protein V7S43_018004 [Phytophthora oleae]|uniref:Uncharacterized protein n=1 Tax=Phytophthora oleae TaxID=2107226 RepID=A0ABD3ESD1_9STRA
MDDVAFEASMAGFLHEFNLTSDKITVMEGGISPDSHGPQKAALSKLKANERCDRYRKKLQNERETLRRQERELSVELVRLQEAEAQAKKEENTLALSAWRATAARQKEKRLEAEQEQQQLKAAVRCRAEAIRRMSVMLALLAPVKTLAASEEQVDAHGALLFKMLVGELDALYDRTDDFVKDSMDLVSPEDFALKRKWGADWTLLEGTNAAELPVAFGPTWRCLSSILLSDPLGTHYTGEIDDPENTAAITYRLNYALESGDTARLIVYNVVRRYVEKDRVVFVWRVLSEGQGEFDGLYADEHAWLVVRPSGSANSPLTTLESFTQLKPMGLSASSDSRGHRFVKLLQKADEEDIADLKQLVQRLLLGESQPDSDVVMELNLKAAN